MSLPLQDIRVVAIEQYGAGPYGTMQLADLGADIIRIEDPATSGDTARSVPPYVDEGTSLFFESFNRNKRSVALDLRNAASREVFERLVKRADALVYNLRGDVADRLRLRYAHLALVNPTLVCVSLSAFGATGPRRAQGGYDFTLQGIAGWMTLTGGPDQPPTKSGLSLVDYCAGYVLALAVVSGVHRARRDGVGCDADLSLFDTALAQLAYVGTWVATEGFAPPRQPDSAHLSVVPFQTFPTADGSIVIACPKESLWRGLCEAIARPELVDDERFADMAGRERHRGELVALLRAEFEQRPTTHWIELLERRGIPCGRVNDVAGALADPQAEARKSVVAYAHPVFGEVRTVAGAVRFPADARRLEPAPLFGEHTYEVLTEVCGYDDAQIREFDAAGAFGHRQEEVEA